MRFGVFVPIFFLFLLFGATLSQAQVPADSSGRRPDAEAASSIKSEVKRQDSQKAQKLQKESFRTKGEVNLTTLFLIFSAFVLLITALLLYKFSADCNITFRYFVITLLILGMILLIIIGLDKEQISPAVGLFSTIAAYLLGKSEHAGVTAPAKNRNGAASQPPDGAQQ